MLPTTPDKFQNAIPFPHLVIDGWLADAAVKMVNIEWPESGWKEYQKQKRGMSQGLPPCAQVLSSNLSRQYFIDGLEAATGISGLVFDPEQKGAGLHETLEGGSLGMHVDFNTIEINRIPHFRRLNVILFLTMSPQNLSNASLRLASAALIEPRPGRMLIMESLDRSWHGHPLPLITREGQTRRTFAAYYYTREPGPHSSEKHSTIYSKAK